ncbi:MAG: hypothetical protein R3Y04_00085 [Rikenellaceae bacterium]
MEQKNRVQFTTSQIFILEHEEQKRLYTYLSLFQYCYLRYPSYNELQLFRTLEKDFKLFSQEMQSQYVKDPNNLTLSRINKFFAAHYSNIKHLREEMENTTNSSVDND